MTTSHRISPLLFLLRRESRRGVSAWLGVVFLFLSIALSAQENLRFQFDIPAGDAAVALRQFSAQSGQQILFSSEAIQRVRTNPVRGELTPVEALNRLLHATGLVARRDEATGAYSVRREGKNERTTRTAAVSGSRSASERDVTAGGSESARGRLAGQVANAVTGAYLEGAQVRLSDGTRVETTDRQGRYALNLAPGVYQVTVSYTGLDAGTREATVLAGETTLLDFPLTAQIYSLEKFTVQGEREGAALAITLQRGAPNVKNVVATDSLGNMADGNVGDFLQRLPGVAGEYVGDDVRTVLIRGISADLSSVTMDGERVASNASAGLGRAFEFEQASLGLIETIELTKAPTPDMPADSVGGNVNLKTKSAFDRATPRSFSYTVGAVWRPTKNRSHSDHWTKEPVTGMGPSLNFTFSDVVGEKKNIGILVTGTWHSQPGSKNRAALMNYQDTVSDPAYVYSTVLPRLNGAPRTRLATGLKIDYKLSERTILTLNSVYNWFHENNDTRTMTLQTSQALATFNAAGVRTGNGTIHPNYTKTFTEVLTHNNSLSTMSLTTLDKSGRTYQFAPSVTHRLDSMAIDYGASWSESSTFYDTHGDGRHYDSRPKGTVTAALRNIGWTVDRGRDLQWPDIRQTTGLDMYDLGNYGALTLTQPARTGVDRSLSARFNLRKDMELPVPAYFKTGLNYRRQERTLAYNSKRFTYAGSTSIRQFLETPNSSAPRAQGYYIQPPWPDPYRIAGHVVDTPNAWTEDVNYGITQTLQNDKTVSEVVGAAYLMGSVKLGQLNILGGVRVETTESEGQGPLVEITPEERTRRAAWSGPLTRDEILRRAHAEYGGRVESSGQYRNVFPSLHFKYDVTKSLLARLSYSNGIGRPDFGSIIPQVSANYDTEVLTTTNPGLRPQYVDNFDFTVEYYFEPAGVISAGVFLKEVSDFIYQDQSGYVGLGANNGYDGMYQGFNIVTSNNGGSARYRGFELNYNQQFTFLPGFWRGFGLGANYTQLETEGDYGGTVATSVVAGFLPKTGNVMLNYRNTRWDIRLLMNWRDTYLIGVSSSPARLRYQAPRSTVNVKTRYTLSRGVQLFCDIDNVFSELAVERYWGTPDRPSETQKTTPKVVMGLQGRF